MEQSSTEQLLTEVTVHSLSGTRWFRNTFADLLVETNEDGLITNFSFSYTKRNRSLSLEWDGFRLRTFQIDEGDSKPLQNQTPIVSGELSASPKEAHELLSQVGSHLDPDIYDFVCSRIGAAV